MNQGYLDFVINGMEKMFDGVTDFGDRPYLLAASLSRFMNCDSLLDLSETFGINKSRLYKSADSITPCRWLRRIIFRGRKRLLQLLKRWHMGDPSYKSRHPITFAADDFTRSARGALGNWVGLFYSGAKKGVTTGINIEALVAVIGDGDEVILLDIRIVPPPAEQAGRPPLNHNEWLRRALRNLHSWVLTNGSHFRGCPLSVDAAYISPANVALVKDLGMILVGKMSARRKVSGKIWGTVIAPVNIFAGISLILDCHRIGELRGEEEVGFIRNKVWVESLHASVLMVTFFNDEDALTYFSTNLGMKTITLRNIIRYRWQLERIFWILKQDIGIGDIHHHKENRVEARIYLHFILAQILRDASAVFGCSPKTVMRGIRRFPHFILHKLGFHSAFASSHSPESVLTVPLAA